MDAGEEREKSMFKKISNCGVLTRFHLPIESAPTVITEEFIDVLRTIKNEPNAIDALRKAADWLVFCLRGDLRGKNDMEYMKYFVEVVSCRLASEVVKRFWPKESVVCVDIFVRNFLALVVYFLGNPFLDEDTRINFKTIFETLSLIFQQYPEAVRYNSSTVFVDVLGVLESEKNDASAKALLGIVDLSEFVGPENTDVWAPIEDWEGVDCLLFVNYFGRIGGFNRILKLFTTAKDGPVISVEEMIIIIEFFDGITGVVQAGSLRRMSKIVFDYVFDMVAKIETSALKPTTRKLYVSLMKQIDSLSLECDLDYEKSHELIENQLLEFHFKCFTSQILELRIRGLTEICDVLVANGERPETKDTRGDQDQAKNRVELTSGFLVKWLKNNKVMEILFGPNLHPELVKRGHAVPLFLLRSGEFERGHIDLVWQNFFGQHETSRDIVFDLFRDITIFFTLKNLDYLFRLIEETEMSAYDYQTLQLIKELAFHYVNRLSRYEAEMKPREPNLGLLLIWRFATSQSEEIDASLRNHAILLVKDAMLYGYSWIYKDFFIDDCIRNMKVRTSFSQALLLLSTILDTYPRKAPKRTPGSDAVDENVVTKQSVVSRLNSRDSFIGIVINNLKYLKMNQDDYDDRKYYYEIQVRIQFIQDSLLSTTFTLSRRQLEALWDLFVVDESSDLFEKELFATFLEHLRQQRNITDEDTKHMFLSKISVDLDFAHITQKLFSLLEYFFRYINFKEGRFVQTDDMRDEWLDFVVMGEVPIGVETFWRIAMEAEDVEVGSICIKFLYQIYSHLHESLEDKRTAKKLEFVKICLKKISECSEKIKEARSKQEEVSEMCLRAVERSMSLLATLLREGEIPEDEFGNARHVTSVKGKEFSVNVSFFGRVIPSVVVAVHTNQTLGNFIVDITEFVRVKTKEVSMMELEEETDEDRRRLILRRLKSDVENIRVLSSGRELISRWKTLGDHGVKPNQPIYVQVVYSHVDVEEQGERKLRRSPVFEELGSANISNSEEESSGIDEVIIIGTNESMSSISSDSVEFMDIADESEGLFSPREPEITPSKLISEKENFEMLFNLFDAGSKKIAEDVWWILMNVPSNTEMLSAARNLEFGYLAGALSQNSPHRALYTLHVLRRAMIGADDDAEGTPWTSRFVSSGGVGMLANFIMDDELHPNDYEEMRRECLSLVFSLLNSFLLISPKSESGKKPKIQIKPEPKSSSTGVQSDDVGVVIIHPTLVSRNNAVLSKSTFEMLGDEEWQRRFVERLLKILEKSGIDHSEDAASETTMMRVVDDGLSDYESAIRSVESMYSGRDDSMDVSELEVEIDVEDPILHEMMFNALSQLYCMMQASATCRSAFLEFDGMSNWIEQLVLEVRDEKIRALVGDFLEYTAEIEEEDEGSSLAKYILFKLLETLETVVVRLPDESLAGLEESEYITMKRRVGRSDEFFTALISFIETCNITDDVIVRQIRDRLYKALVDHVGVDSEMVEDNALIGILKLLNSLHIGYEYLKSDIRSAQLIKLLFTNHLMDYQTLEMRQNCRIRSGANLRAIVPPKCKSEISRRYTFNLLYTLCEGNREGVSQVIELISTQLDVRREQENPNVQLQEGQELSRHKKKPWYATYGFFGFEKSPTGYVGLKNHGATCYMNSLFQQFYMIPQLKSGILQSERIADESSEGNGLQLLNEVKRIMAYLQESELKYFETTRFTKVFKDAEGNLVDVGQQMDVQEFLSTLIDRLEGELKHTNEASLLRDTVGGVITNQIICMKDKSHVVERDEDMYTLSLEIKNKNNILESLALFVGGEMLMGDNRYMCSTCGCKVDALKRECIKVLPNTLIIHLKRLEFDYETMRRNKVNEFCEFPMVLDMEPYTREGLRKAEENGKNKDSSDEEGAEEKSSDGTDDSARSYSLVGVLVHAGTADSGHYYSYIKKRAEGPDERQEWYHFNDNTVEKFDPSDIPSLCFGGNEKVSQYDTMSKRTVRRVQLKPYSAYILFYERDKPGEESAMDGVTSGKDEIGAGTVSEYVEGIPRPLFEEVWGENLSHLRDRNIFDSQYYRFFWELLSMPFGKNMSRLIQLATPALIQLGLRFFVDILSHTREKGTIITWLSFFQEKMHEEYGRKSGIDMLTEMGRPDCPWLEEIFFECPSPETREAFRQLVGSVLGIHLQVLDDEEYFALTSPFRSIGSERDSLIYGLGLSKPLVSSGSGDIKELRAVTLPIPVVLLAEDNSPNPFYELSRHIPIRFLERLLSMLSHSPEHTRTYAEYFGLLTDIAELSWRERRYLIERNLVCHLIDIFLGDKSPLPLDLSSRCSTHSSYPGEEKKDATDTGYFSLSERRDRFVARPVFRELLALLALLVKSSDIAGAKSAEASGEGSEKKGEIAVKEEHVPLMDIDRTMLQHESFLLHMLQESTSTPAGNIIMAHMCRGSHVATESVLAHILEHLAKVEYAEFPKLFETLSELIGIDDRFKEMRTDAILSHVIEKSVEKQNQANYMTFLLRFTRQLINEHDICRGWILESDRWRKFLIPHIFSHVESVRHQTELTFRSLAPMFNNVSSPLRDARPVEVDDGRLPEDIEASREAEKEALERDKVTMAKILLGLLDQFQKCFDFVEAPVRDIRSRLVNYLRLLQWTMRTREDQLRFRQIASRGPKAAEAEEGSEAQVVPPASYGMDELLLLFWRIDALKIECDENKLELTRLLYMVMNGCVRNIKTVTESEVNMTKMFLVFLSLPKTDDERFITYNREALPPFYRIYYICARNSQEFLINMISHENFDWAINNVFFAQFDYGASSDCVYNLIRLSIDAEDEYDNFRTRWINNVLQQRRLSEPKFYERAVLLLKHLLLLDADAATFSRAGGFDQLADAMEYSMQISERVSEDELELLHSVTSRQEAGASPTNCKMIKDGFQRWRRRAHVFGMMLRMLSEGSVSGSSLSFLYNILRYMVKMDSACKDQAIEHFYVKHEESHLLEIEKWASYISGLINELPLDFQEPASLSPTEEAAEEESEVPQTALALNVEASKMLDDLTSGNEGFLDGVEASSLMSENASPINLNPRRPYRAFDWMNPSEKLTSAGGAARGVGDMLKAYSQYYSFITLLLHRIISDLGSGGPKSLNISLYYPVSLLLMSCLETYSLHIHNPFLHLAREYWDSPHSRKVMKDHPLLCEYLVRAISKERQVFSAETSIILIIENFFRETFVLPHMKRSEVDESSEKADGVLFPLNVIEKYAPLLVANSREILKAMNSGKTEVGPSFVGLGLRTSLESLRIISLLSRLPNLPQEMKKDFDRCIDEVKDEVTTLLNKYPYISSMELASKTKDVLNLY